MNAELTQQMKEWFGSGEYDVDLMLRVGAVTPETIQTLWENDPSSPGYISEEKHNEQ